jgi:hypothetical protein
MAIGQIWMNDNFQGGITQYPYQKLNISPIKGLLGIFPTGIAYEHISTPITAGEKFIIRTRFSYKESKTLTPDDIIA